MEQNINFGIDSSIMKQDIALDIDMFKEILSRPKEGNNSPYTALYEVYKKILEYHNIACNSKWADEIDIIEKAITDQTTKDYFGQFLIRDSRINKIKVNDDDTTDEYIYNIAKCLQQKILVTNKDKDTDYKLNAYNEQQFVSDKYKNDCVLYRLPKILGYTSGDIFNDFNFLSFYFNDCTLVEFIDAFLLDPCKPNYNSSLDFILSFLGQIKEGTNIRFHYDIANSKDFEYKLFCNEIKKAYPSLKLCKPEQKNGKNHDRFIIIDKNKYSMTFTASFNNIEKKINVFEVNKTFKIIIEEGRLY